MVSESLNKEMQNILSHLNIPLTISWTPNSDKPIHGEIKHDFLYVYDEKQNDALATFMHETIEFKLQEMTKVYRELVNCLISGYERLAYQEKERFIAFVPKFLEAQNLKDKASE